MHWVVLGLSITSSWGNGHATTYRGLLKELHERGHTITFLERDVEWYASNRDLPDPDYVDVELYHDLQELRERLEGTVVEADVAMVGSYVPDGVTVGEWVLSERGGPTMFYDIDTPVTLAKLRRGDHEYLHPDLVPRYDAYLSFTGGPTLDRIEQDLGAPHAWPLYCSVDPDHYHPVDREHTWRLGYLGTYSTDRQPKVRRFLLDVARERPDDAFVVAGPEYPDVDAWPGNVEHLEHLPPAEHVGFYNAQDLTLNVTRADMVEAGWSPSVRLFEASACGVPIVSDRWQGLDAFFTPGEEILVADTTEDVEGFLEMEPDALRAVGERAREHVLAHHTSAHRAASLEGYAEVLLGERQDPPRDPARARSEVPA